ncbi:MAG: TdeIII family type II restriction endonuclease, partial [Leptospiraceae bacterium]|nr:TdeIII family type II restriction endonuclease [Leptospiraceae bacterium]
NKSKSKYSINTVPYNPYDPKPFSRWTLRGMIDLENALRVAEEFLDYLGGKSISGQSKCL